MEIGGYKNKNLLVWLRKTAAFVLPAILGIVFLLSHIANASTSQAPTGLTTSTTDSAINLTWTAPSDDGGETITDYQVEYKKSANTTWNVYSDGVSTDTSATVDGLENEALYDFRVSAINASGPGALSDVVKATPLPPGVLAFFDPMNATPGAVLSATQPEIGTWATATGNNYEAQISPSNRIYGRTTNGGGISLSKIADIPMTSQGVYGEMELTVTGSFSAGRLSAAIMLRGTSASKDLVAMYNGTNFRIMRFTASNAATTYATATPALNIGQTYKVRFEASPGSQKLYLDGTLIASSTASEATLGLDGNAVGIRLQTDTTSGSVFSDSSGPQIQKVKFGKILASAPVDLDAVPGTTSPDVDLSWSKPPDVADAEITDYVYQYREIGSTGPWTDFLHTASTNTSVTITGLTVGTDYEFRVAAVTAEGTGEFTAPVSVATVPDPPTSVSAVAGNASATISFTAPANDGGKPITSYTVTASPGGATASGSTSPITVAGLTNGTSYTFTVTATNAIGESLPSVASNTVTPTSGVVAPDPPTAVSAVAGNTTATISFIPPASDGGEAITSYTVTSSPGGITATGSGSPIIVTGLTNGTSYTFTVTATNAIGTSVASLPSNAVTPNVTKLVVFGDSITVGMNASPVSTNSWAVLYSSANGYTLNNKGVSGTVLQNSNDNSGSPRTNNGRDRFVSALLGSNKSDKYVIMYGLNDLRYKALPSDFSLENYRHDYAEILAGVIRAGISPSDIILASPTWIPDAGYSSGSTGFTGSNRTIHESYVAAVASLAQEYGTKYVDTYTLMRDSGVSATLIDTDNIHPNNTGHAFIYNAMMTSQTTPNVYLAAGSINASSPSQGRLTVTWTAPASGTVTGYEVERSNASGSYEYFETKSETGLSTTFEGLAAGSYFTRVRPVYAGGDKGPWLFTSPGTPVVGAAVPAVPTGLSATADTGSVDLSWTAPADNGASITDYVIQYRTSPSGTWTTFADGTSTAISATVTGLTGGTAYDFQVSAVNSVGTSSYSAIVTETPLSTPGAPTGLIATRGNTQVQLSWTAPANDGGYAISDYIIEYKASSSGTWTTFADGTSTATTATVTGLTNGTSYDFRVSAVNSIGTGASSNVATATPATTPNAPTINVTPTAGGANLSWAAPDSGGSAITDYIVEYKLSTDSSWTTYTDGVSTDTSASLTGLTVNTSYDFRVTAVNAIGNGASSAVVSAITLNYNVTIKYGDVALSDGMTIGKSSTFTGTANPGSFVEVTVQPGDVTCSATADASGNWNCTLPTKLAPGDYTVSAVVTLPLGAGTVDLGPYSVNVKSDTDSSDDNRGDITILPPSTGAKMVFDVKRQSALSTLSFL